MYQSLKKKSFLLQTRKLLLINTAGTQYCYEQIDSPKTVLLTALENMLQFLYVKNALSKKQYEKLNYKISLDSNGRNIMF